MMLSSRKKAQSLPPLKPQTQSYLQRTIQLADSDCLEGNHLKIDGSFGDYRMRLFRRKDKKSYENNIKSVFTHTFTQSLLPAQNPDIKAKMEDIITSKRHREEHQMELVDRARRQKEVSYTKGSLAHTLEEEDHLIYSYLPEYQRSRWFQIKDNSSKKEAKPVQRASGLVRKDCSPKKKSKNKYIFAYLQSLAKNRK